MQRTGAIDYSVKRADFPIKIELEGFDLAAFQGVPSDVVVTLPNGTSITTFPLIMAPVPGKPLLQTGKLLDPGDPGTPAGQRYNPPAEVNFVFAVGFSTPNGPDPRYELRMNAASGDRDSRTVRPPDLNIATHLEYR